MGRNGPLQGRTNMKAFTAVFVARIVGLGGCMRGAVEGDGKPRTETRTLSPVSDVDAETSLDVVVTPGDAASVTITTDENLVDLVVTEVVGGTLHIREPLD